MPAKVVREFSTLIMRKSSYLLSALIGYGCLSPVASMAQGSPITDAYRQLRLLSSSTEAGISYNNFGDEWRKALGFINIAIEDSKPSKLTEKLQEVKLIYSDASDFWSCRFSSKYISVAINHCLNSGFKDRNPVTMEFLRGQLSRSEYMEMGDVVPAVVPVMFGKGSQQVRELGELLKKK